MGKATNRGSLIHKMQVVDKEPTNRKMPLIQEKQIINQQVVGKQPKKVREVRGILIRQEMRKNQAKILNLVQEVTIQKQARVKYNRVQVLQIAGKTNSLRNQIHKLQVEIKKPEVNLLRPEQAKNSSRRLNNKIPVGIAGMK